MTLTSEPAKAIDPQVLRADFPILRTTVHGKPLIYLDSASTSQKPQVVIDAVDEFYREYNANVHRGIYEIGERVDRRLRESARADRAVHRRVGRARGHLHAQRHRGDQPRGLFSGAASRSAAAT